MVPPRFCRLFATIPRFYPLTLLSLFVLAAAGVAHAGLLSSFQSTSSSARTKWLPFPTPRASSGHVPRHPKLVGPVPLQREPTPIRKVMPEEEFDMQPSFTPELEPTPAPEIDFELSMPSPTPTSTEDIDRPFDFDNLVGVRLQASKFVVTVAGRSFSPTGDVDIHGDPGTAPLNEFGDAGYTTLELIWFEQNTEMRVNIYFASNTTHWWITEIRTYNGEDPGDWITRTGRYVLTPLGQSFVGDLRVGTLYIADTVLQAFIPGKTSCDGSGAPGELLMERSNQVPVSGTLPHSGLDSLGYAFTVDVLDASACEPHEANDVDFRAYVSDPDVAVPQELLFRPTWAPQQLYVSVLFTGVGETVLTIDAVDKRTGDVLSSVDVPVAVIAE